MRFQDFLADLEPRRVRALASQIKMPEWYWAKLPAVKLYLLQHPEAAEIVARVYKKDMLV